VEKQLTLSELNAGIREALEGSFPEQLWVTAEIGELKVNRNGHCYLELIEKDALTDDIIARSRATIWSWQFRFIQPYFETSTGQALQAGIKILAAVSVEFHEVYGISLNIKDIDPSYTMGDMARKRREIIQRLTDDGIMDMNKEILMPELPQRVAIISSPTAAGFEDFVNQLQNNEYGFRFYLKLFPASMQGKDAARSIIGALDAIYRLENHFDVVVVIRGGGAQMDLICFDDYELASHVAQFPLPVLSGIGHEKDETIVDLVAHQRLKTPTAVAEFLIGCLELVANEIEELENACMATTREIFDQENNRMTRAFQLFKPVVSSKLESTSLKLQMLAKSIAPKVNEMMDHQHFRVEKLTDHLRYGTHAYWQLKYNQLAGLRSQSSFKTKMSLNLEFQHTKELQQRLLLLPVNKIEQEKNKLLWLERTKQLVDPSSILKRGFSITLHQGKAIKDASVLENGEQLETVLYKGKVKSIVKK
jgi:exodeoxyribonuclease VII large subunit